jgi:hypothetical protein
MYTCTIYVNINAPTFGSALCDLNCQKCNSTVSPQSMLQCMLHSPHLLLETVTPTVLLSSLLLVCDGSSLLALLYLQKGWKISEKRGNIHAWACD